MPSGGQLVIETTSFDADREFAEGHLSVLPGRHVMLSVSDNGVGMSKEVQAHLFEPFFTTKDPGKGTGLGLSTVYGIVQQSGGSILVYSEPRLGTAFRMLFPAVAGGVRTEPVPIPITEQSGTETILLVEDEPSVRKYVSQVLRRRGYVVLEAANGKEGLELAARTGGKIDLLLTDLVMPEMGGAELAARFRGESSGGTPVLCVSGYTDRLWRPEDPNVSFLQKPFTVSDLLTRIRELLAARRSASA
jgi:CheY-like chemotaxis protein